MRITAKRHVVYGSFFLLLLAGCSYSAFGQSDVRVNVWTVKVIDKSGKTENLPGVKVTIGGSSTTTDGFGRGFVVVAPGFHTASALGPCRPLWVPSGSPRRTGGTEYQPQLEFTAGKTHTVVFSFDCLGSGTAPAEQPAADCFASDRAMVSQNPSMHRGYALEVTTRPAGQDLLMKNLARKVDLLGECKAVTHDHLSFLLAEVSWLPPQAGWTRPNPRKPGGEELREPQPEIKPQFDWQPYKLRPHVEWARQQSRTAVLEEIKKRMAFRMLYGHEWVDEAFVSMSLAIANWYHEAAKQAKAELGRTGMLVHGGYFVKASMPIQAANAKVTVRPRSYATEPIIVDYSNPNGSSRDYVILVQPGSTGTGPYGSISADYAWPVGTAGASRTGNFSGWAIFAPLAQGTYEARYISVDPTGNGRTAATQQADPNSSPQTGGSTSPITPFGDLTGTWRNPGGKAVYRLRQIGTKVVWLVDAVTLGSYANVFRGQRSDNTIDGIWDDLPGSPTIGGGRIKLKIESNCRITRDSSVNQYGADVWVRIGSPCDTGK